MPKERVASSEKLNTLCRLFMEEKPLDFTFPLIDSIAARGMDSPPLVTDVLLGSSRFFSRLGTLFPHSITHINLPWTINWELIKAETEQLTAMQRKKQSGQTLEPKEMLTFDVLEYRLIGVPEKISIASKDSTTSKEIVKTKREANILPCVILNFKSKQDVLEDFLSENEGQRALSVVGGAPGNRFLTPTLSGNDMKRIIVNLAITPEEILEKIGGTGASINSGEIRKKLKGKVVLFFTGWNAYYRPYSGMRNLSNPFFECWHPYLLHPFLDLRASEFLLNAGVEGIGSDTYGFECPIYFVDPQNCYTAVSEVVSEIERNRRVLVIGSRKVVLPFYPPIHLCFANAAKYQIENLNMPIGLFGVGETWSSLRFQSLPGVTESVYQEGVLALIPFATAREEDERLLYDFLLLKVFYWRET